MPEKTTKEERTHMILPLQIDHMFGVIKQKRLFHQTIIFKANKQIHGREK